MADNVIATGSDNHPSMLKRSQYDPWQSRMLLYKQGKEHGKKLLQSTKEGLFPYGTITDPATETSPATTRARTMDDLSPKENIHEGFAKELWDRVKLLIEGSELSLQE
nr:hypothetical protein [Tanacetum cinerariifolium]